MAAYSVLMSVYCKEKPEYFRTAIQSMIDQTVKADDFVIVCDGPLTDELEKVLLWAREMLNERLKVVRISENGGLGRALNEGLKYVKNELVARMDSDDVSLPARCEMQLNAFSRNPEVSIVSGTVEEFCGDIDCVTARRVLPGNPDEIFEFAKYRNPFNHPCVMFKKSAVVRAGGYLDLRYLEDYFLWVRMLLNNEKGLNLQEPLLRMRAGFDMYRRRGGGKYVLSQIRLFSFMRKKGMITRMQFMKNIGMRTVSALMPARLRRLLFMKLLRK